MNVFEKSRLLLLHREYMQRSKINPAVFTTLVNEQVFLAKSLAAYTNNPIFLFAECQIFYDSIMRVAYNAAFELPNTIP
jgi:hypothetical protein